MSIFPQPDFSTEDEAFEFLKDVLQEFPEISNIAYLALNLPGRETNDPVVLATYAPDWVQHYLDENYALIDPAIVEGMQGISPFDWSERRSNSKRIKQFFGEAGEFGVNHNGLSIPIRGPHGDKAVFSVNCDLSDKEWQNFKIERQAHLLMLAGWYHENFVQIAGDVEIRRISLAPREREVLVWASHGKTAWETGQILGISGRTVEFYLNLAMNKLRVFNKQEAIRKGVKLGLI